MRLPASVYASATCAYLPTSACVCMHALQEDDLGGEFVGVDVDSVDAVEYPGMKLAVFDAATIRPGDCAYIPSMLLQHVRETCMRLRACACICGDLHTFALTCRT